MRRAAILAALDGTGRNRWVAFALKGVILVSAVLIVLETVPAVQDRIGKGLWLTELVIVGVFAVEYLLRLICTPHPLRYVTSFWGIVDLLSWLPTVVFLGGGQMHALRILRLIRLARLLRIARLRAALSRIENALHDVRDELLLFSFLAALMLYLSAVGIYYFEHPAQPEVFTSIPASLWWALATFTTVGYGDMIPITTGGRLFSAVVLLIGLGIVAVPVGLVTSALLTADERLRNSGDKSDTHKGDPP